MDPTILNQPPQFQPKHEPIFCCINVERDCKPNRNFHEVGCAILDTRKVKDVAPGDRCQNWFRYIQTEHVRITDNWHSGRSHHPHWCRPNPDCFAFGKTKYKPTNNMRDYFTSKWANLVRDQPLSTKPQGVDTGVSEEPIGPYTGPSGSTSGTTRAWPQNPPKQTPPEQNPPKSKKKESKKKNPDSPRRNIILVVWAGQQEGDTIEQLKFNLIDTVLEKWDFQKHDASQYFSRAVRKPLPSLGDFAEALRVRTTDVETGETLLHNGGNDAGFALQTMLATMCLTSTQVDELCSDGRVSGPELVDHINLNCLKFNRIEARRLDGV
ncbi:hypothetical protein ANO11243_081470 [Dothideomycetidae sp. 11243]|nr:hypothetical protein ANO11243_081470 [fungal sp. No.11243]